MTQISPITLESTSGPVELFGAGDRDPVALFFHPGVGLGLVFPALQGCTAELCGLRDRSDELEAANVRSYGVSTLGLEPMNKFVEDHHLSFPLVSDPDAQLGAWFAVSSEQSAGDLAVYERITILVVPDGEGYQVHRVPADDAQVEAILAILNG